MQLRRKYPFRLSLVETLLCDTIVRYLLYAKRRYISRVWIWQRLDPLLQLVDQLQHMSTVFEKAAGSELLALMRMRSE